MRVTERPRKKLTFIIEHRDQRGIRPIVPVQVLLDGFGGEPSAVVLAVMDTGFEGVVSVLHGARVVVLDSVEVWWFTGYRDGLGHRWGGVVLDTAGGKQTAWCGNVGRCRRRESVRPKRNRKKLIFGTDAMILGERIPQSASRA